MAFSLGTATPCHGSVDNAPVTDAPSTARPADRWRELLRSSAVPQEIIDASPEPDVSLEPARFRWNPEEDARQPVRPSRRRALEALPEGGSVLDVGVGGGASSLGLGPKAGLIVGVDPMEGMLESFEASAREAGVAAQAVLGTWPEVAGEVEPADVAVCHHAIYRTMEVEDFAGALTERARRRVVIEVSDRSPLSALDPLWKAFHGLDRPDWSVADELQAVVVAMGLAVEREDLLLPPRTQEVTPELVAFSRRRLHVGPERDAEIEEWLRARQPAEHRVAALWWPGTAS
jgi:SAM-dependent methyltransferase